MKFEQIDGCPCPADLAPVLRRIRERIRKGTNPSFIYTSIYRGSDPGAASILKKFGKASQAWLYRAYWVLHLPGYRPANRPGQSTHELRNDGVAYRGPVGMVLAPYKVGIDSSSAAQFVAEAAREGLTATVTYPGNPLESQHANFRKAPKIKLFRALKRGQRSPRVSKIRKSLAYVRSPHTGKPYLAAAKRARGSQWFFDDDLYHALRAFQRDHHQKDDGIYGLQTARQLAVSVRFRNQQDKKKGKSK